MADFTTYAQVATWLGKGKKRSEGRRKRAIMLRMDAAGVIIVAHARKQYGAMSGATSSPLYKLTDFAELRSNNTLIFTTTSAELLPVAASLSSMFHRIFGLAWDRVGRGRYVIHSYAPGENYREARKKGHEHYRGMQWDIFTGQCLNPRLSILKTVNKDKRKDWVASLKKFRRAVHTRVKLGVIEKMLQAHPTNGQHVQLDILTSKILDAIKTGDVHTDLLENIVAYTIQKNRWRSKDSKAVKTTVESIISGNSVYFRQEFGVLKK